jgi:two-component system chemotaxis response regulator CheY
LFQSSGVSVVISDWMMPKMDGVELCRRVREQPGDAYAYFIFLTSRGNKQDLLTGMRAGADDYLTKPLDTDDLQVRLIAASRVTALHQRLGEQRAELERLNLQLFGEARTDPLTRLGNRLRLWEDLEALQGRAERYGQPYCLAMCDVDFFKRYNDSCGHQAGDEVLREVAAVITRHCRSSDTAYRYGGEEFLLLLPEQSLKSAATAVDRLRRAVEEMAIPHPGNTPSGVVTISAGIASLPPGGGKTLVMVQSEADIALYRSKALGRNRVEAYEVPASSP